jgi:hypothetical protein
MTPGVLRLEKFAMTRVSAMLNIGKISQITAESQSIEKPWMN